MPFFLLFSVQETGLATFDPQLGSSGSRLGGMVGEWVGGREGGKQESRKAQGSRQAAAAAAAAEKRRRVCRGKAEGREGRRDQFTVQVCLSV